MTRNVKSSVRPNPSGDWPQVDPTAYINPTARIIGNVTIGPDVFIGPGAVIRADESDSKGHVHPVNVGARCNVQDGVIIHALGGTAVTIGPRTSLAHGSIIHGPCTLGADCFVGFRAVVYNAKLGDGVFVGTGAVVQGVDLDANSLVPACAVITSAEEAEKLVTKTSPKDTEFMKKVVDTNITLTQGYLRLEKTE
jgi:carbonic anhydrase/acetyltransferase-like protein (isoleucine patch superfamily)